MPIHQLLNRIRWDAEFGQADFGIGNYDQMEGGMVVVAIRQIRFSPDNYFSIEVIDDGGKPRLVPLHRIRQVSRNGDVIWGRHQD